MGFFDRISEGLARSRDKFKEQMNVLLDRGPDFMKLAAAYGLSGARVNAVETFAAAFKAAVEKREPCIIECMLDIDEMVAPMVAPGSPIHSFCLN